MPGRSKSDNNELAANIHSLVRFGDKPAKDQLTDSGNIAALVSDMNVAFATLDTKHRDLLTNKQLGQLMENQNLHGADAATAAALFKLNNELQNGDINLGFQPDKNGLTKKELLQLEHNATNAPKGCLTGPDDSNINTGTPDLWAGTQFVLVHKSESDKIYTADIDKAITGTKGDAETKRSLKFFKEHFAEIASDAGHSADKGVTFKEMQNFAQKYKNDCSPLWEMRGILINHAKVVQEKMPAALYAKQPPIDSISHMGIEQGSSGDCYFESPLGVVSDLHKRDVAKMIVHNGNQTFTVTFPGHTEHYTVTKPTEAERTLYNKGAAVGDWPTVVEKAYGLWANDTAHKGAVQKNWEVPEDYSGHAGKMDRALSLLTNRDTQTTWFKNVTEDTVRQHLLNLGRDNRAAVVNREREDFASDELVDLPMQHTYAIVDYDPKGSGGGTVTIRNPWAGADGTYSGTFKMPLDQFVKSFGEMSEETEKQSVTAINPVPAQNHH